MHRKFRIYRNYKLTILTILVASREPIIIRSVLSVIRFIWHQERSYTRGWVASGPWARGMWLNTSWLRANPVPSLAAVAATYHFLVSPRGESHLHLHPPTGDNGISAVETRFHTRGLRMIYANVQKVARYSRLGALAGTHHRYDLNITRYSSMVICSVFFV